MGTECPDCLDAPPRWEHTAALLPDGRVLIAGGIDSGSTSLATSSILFDLADESFEQGPALIHPRRQHLQVVLPEGDVLLIGGYDSYSDIDTPRSVEVYRSATNNFEELGQLTNPVGSTGTAVLIDDTTLAVFTFSESQRVVEVFDLIDGVTIRVDALPHDQGTIQPLRDGTALIYGDPDPDDTNPASVITRVDLMVTGTPVLETLPGPLDVTHAAVSTALGEDGRVFFAGGVISEDGVSYPSTARTFMFDPVSGEFEERAEMAVGRTSPFLQSLSGMRAVAAGCQTPCPGGRSGSVGFGAIEIYDPASDAWTLVGLSLSRENPSLTELSDGRILVLGGWGRTVSDGYGGAHGPLPFAEIVE